MRRGAFLAGLGLLTVLGGAVAADDLSGASTIHRVRPGDTVARICWQYKVRTDYILAANPGLTEPLTAGRQLVIPLGPGPGVPADPPVSVVPAERPAPRIAAPVPTPPPPTVLMAKAVSLPPPLPPPPPITIPEPEVAETPPPPSTVERTSFSAAARELASHRLRYNERWTPPGEGTAWVMDCSNTSRYLYRAVTGVDIGRTASDQYYFLRLKKRAWDVPTGWDHLPRLDYLRKHLEPGDLLFWENTYKPVRSPDITHVMVYLGQDPDGRWQMAGSQQSDGVSIYRFDPQATKGGYSSWFGLVHHEGHFVAYGRPL